MSDNPRDWDPSEVHGGPEGHDPRSGIWRIPGDPLMYPDVFDDAKRFHADRGYWPPGTGMRKREDEQQDRYGAGPDAHPGAQGFGGVLQLTMRQELIAARIGVHTLLSQSLRVAEAEVARRYGEEAAYSIRAYVLREDMPPVTAEVERTVRVTILQVSPATWWDHFKLTFGHRWWLHWLTTRRPARVVDRPQTRRVKVRATFDLDRHRLYPRANRSIVRRLGEPVTFAVARPVRFADWTGGPGVEF